MSDGNVAFEKGSRLSRVLRIVLTAPPCLSDMRLILTHLLLLSTTECVRRQNISYRVIAILFVTSQY